MKNAELWQLRAKIATLIIQLISIGFMIFACFKMLELKRDMKETQEKIEQQIQKRNNQK